MRKSAAVAMGLVLMLLAGGVLAHPPKDVKVEFNPDNHMLMVTAIHDTKDVAKHYVGTIEVDVNGQKMIEQKFKSQVTPDNQGAHYWLNDAATGDTLSVTATCNIAGKKTVTMVVPKKTEQPKKTQ
jgi:hypothetical protein